MGAVINPGILPGTNAPRNFLVTALSPSRSDTGPWIFLGGRVWDSSMDVDVTEETNRDILGNSYTEITDVTVAQDLVWQVNNSLSFPIVALVDDILDRNAFTEFAGFPALVIRAYMGTSGSYYATMWPESTISPQPQGGAGDGGGVDHGIGLTFGGAPVRGTTNIYLPQQGTLTFTP